MEKEAEISVFNAQGVLMMSKSERISSEELSLNLAGLPLGIYLIRLKSEGISCSQKVVKN